MSPFNLFCSLFCPAQSLAGLSVTKCNLQPLTFSASKCTLCSLWRVIRKLSWDSWGQDDIAFKTKPALQNTAGFEIALIFCFVVSVVGGVWPGGGGGYEFCGSYFKRKWVTISVIRACFSNVLLHFITVNKVHILPLKQLKIVAWWMETSFSEASGTQSWRSEWNRCRF